MPRQFKKYANIPYSDNLIENYLKLIKENPRLTTKEIAKKLNCSYQTIKNLRSHLSKAKIMPHSLTPSYPEEKEEEEKEETIKKLKEENEELKEQIKTYEEQIRGINFELIKKITHIELQKLDLKKRIDDIKLKLQNTNDYKERSILKEDLKIFELDYAKLEKELEILKSFLKNVYAK
jgi:transposase